MALALSLSVLVGGAPSAAIPSFSAPTSIPPATATTPIYLALGDSTPVWDGNASYPNQITSYYVHKLPHLQLVNMACSEETTSSMISGSTCAPGGSQYQNALAFLKSRGSSVALITITIGGNDVIGCVNSTDITTCIANGLANMKKNLTAILSGLRAAAAPGVPIVGMTYYNPFLGEWLASSSAIRALATESLPAVKSLNDDLNQVYAAASVPVANVQGAFQVTNMKQRVSSRWGRIPVAVDRACTLLDITCRIGRQEVFGEDPNDRGAEVIAGAFEKVIGPLH